MKSKKLYVQCSLAVHLIWTTVISQYKHSVHLKEKVKFEVWQPDKEIVFSVIYQMLFCQLYEVSKMDIPDLLKMTLNL